MSKILLIKPRFLTDFEFKHITQPLGLMYIGAILKKAGHEPRIHDCAVDYKDLHILRRTIKEWKPDFIGISIMITELEQTQKHYGNNPKTTCTNTGYFWWSIAFCLSRCIDKNFRG